MGIVIRKTSDTLELIKYLSISSMVIDHVGYFVFDDNTVMRFIGRFALIGFSFLLAYNYKYNTRDKLLYKLRLLKWAIISQVPFMLLINHTFSINILFLLLMGLISIDVIDNLIKGTTSIIKFWSILLLSSILVLSIYTGYFIFGVLLIVSFYYVHDHKNLVWLIVLNTVLLNFSLFFSIAGMISLCILYFINIDFSVPRVNKQLFYLFYPLHLLLIWSVK